MIATRNGSPHPLTPVRRWTLLLATGLACILEAVSPGVGPATAAPAPRSPAYVPAEYVSAVTTAPLALCGHDVVDSDLVARQLRGESRFSRWAVSASGAQGPAQLTPRMFAVYGADDDGNGVASPFDIGDAVSALVRTDCAITTDLLATGHAVDPVSVIAAYTGGLTAVDDPDVRDLAQGTLR